MPEHEKPKADHGHAEKKAETPAAKAKAAAEPAPPTHYTIVHAGVGPHRKGAVVAVADLGDEAAIARLTGLGAIAVAPAPEPVPAEPAAE